MPATLVDYLTQVKNGLTAAGVAAAVWAAAPRSLTSFGTTPISSISTALAGNASVDLRPPAGFYQTLLMVGVSGATTYEFCVYDGTTFTLQVSYSQPSPSGNPGAAGWATIPGNSTFGPGIVNASATPGAFAFVGRQWPL